MAKLIFAALLLASCTRKSPQLANLTVWHAEEHATLVRGKCSICRRHGLKSKVTMKDAHTGFCSRGHMINVK